MNLLPSFVLTKIKVLKTFLLCSFCIFIYWGYYSFQSGNLPRDTFEDSEYVTVEETDDEFLFKTTIPMIKKEVIFLHGTLTDPKAFAPLCRKLAMHGYTCHLLKMNWRLPQYGYKKIKRMFNLKQGNYFIGGFSKGGEKAAQIVSENPDMFLGLFLLNTSLPMEIDLSNHKIRCLSITTEKQDISNLKETKLPLDTKNIVLKGGIDRQFGYFNKSIINTESTISLEAQQEQIFFGLINFVR